MEHILKSTDFWVLVSFILFIVLAYWKGRDAIVNAIDGRIHRIRDEIATAERLKEEATARLAELLRAQRDAGEQADAILESAKAEAKALKKEQDARFKEAMARREQQALDKIEQAEAKALSDVRDRAVDIAMAASAAVLAERLAGPDGDVMIDKAISALPGKLH